jgi:hypothetical protein
MLNTLINQNHIIMAKTVNPKSTKNEILDAYEELLTKVQETATEAPRRDMERKTNETIVKSASSHTFDGIVKHMADLKVQLSTELDKLTESFTTEHQQFADLQRAIALEKENLKNLYQLTAETDSLAAMLLAQREKKAQFEAEMAEANRTLETEMAEKRVSWKKEQELQTQQQKEYEESLKKTRKREEEEYAYSLAQQRKKENDAYTQKREQLEKELVQREASIAASEAELAELRKRVEAFPKEMEHAVKSAETTVNQRLTSQYEFEKQLNAKQLEGDKKLNEQVVANLKEKIKDLEANIKDLTVKSAAADAGVKDIALKALESTKGRATESRKGEE